MLNVQLYPMRTHNKGTMFGCVMCEVLVNCRKMRILYFIAFSKGCDQIAGCRLRFISPCQGEKVEEMEDLARCVII